jgi:DNA-binding XRE family transcriptional regulator
MPRQPSNQHPLRTAREILDLSQAAFGAAVGASGRTVQSIELGLLKPSPSLAGRIEKVFGLDREQITTGEDPLHPRFAPDPVTKERKPFTRENYEAFRTAPRKFEREDMDEVLQAFGAVLELGADAANSVDQAPSFVRDLRTLIETFFQKSGIDAPMLRILKGYDFKFSGGLSAAEEIFELNGAELRNYLEARERIRSQWYEKIGETGAGTYRPRAGGLPPKVAEAYGKITEVSPTLWPDLKQASTQSSPKEKSPKTVVPRAPRRDRDNVAGKPSDSHRGRAAG